MVCNRLAPVGPALAADAAVAERPALIADDAYTQPPRFLSGAPRMLGSQSTMFHANGAGSWSRDESCAMPEYPDWMVIG
jgi:hypothetical protein